MQSNAESKTNWQELASDAGGAVRACSRLALRWRKSRTGLGYRDGSRGADVGDLKYRARRNLRFMQRRPQLVRAFWQQAELF
jgi:hypothetical protein